MPNFYVDIIDTTDGTHVLVEENVAASSLVLSWQGGDAKDELFLVGSSLRFALSAPNLSMGHFLHLFTGDEQKYRVEIREVDNDDEVEDAIIWQGFLLPDTYQEPFTNGAVFVDIEAADGLGRLKGKYLPDVMYTKYVSVIDVLHACLAQTGLSMKLRFSAAIQHVSFKKYHNIYIDGTLLIEKDKKQNCYQILDDLLQSMLCVCYQSLGIWYVEGLNVRHQTDLKYDEYDTDGSYIDEIEFTRNIKIATNKVYETPLVTMVPVYKRIAVGYDIEQPRLPDNLTVETNDGWSAESYEYIYADAFFPHNTESFAIASASTEYRVRFRKDYSLSIDPTKKMSLVSPVYVNAGQEVSVEIDMDYGITQASIDKTSLKVQVVLNGGVLHEVLLYHDISLEDEDTELEEGKLTYLKETFLITASGYLDVYFFVPPSDGRASIARDGWVLNTFKITVINQDETFLVQDDVNASYTLEKEVELAYTDEFSGLNKSFLLADLNTVSSTDYNQPIAVFHEFESGGFTYLQVELKEANLCDTFKNNFYADDVNVQVLEVIYNWLGSPSEHMVKLAEPIEGADAYIRIKKNDLSAVDRTTWQQWTDAIYKIENERYGKIVANVYRRMFLEPYEKIDYTMDALVNFNDILVFNFINVRRYVPINLSVDLDNGKSTVTTILNYYHDNAGGVSDNISPILTVKEDFVIPANATSLELTSEAYDPDGFIVSHVWTIVTGTGTSPNFSTPNITVNSLPLETDAWVFRCTVTDNGGAVVSKDVNVVRLAAATLTVTYSCGIVTTHDSDVTPRYQKGVLLDFAEGLSNEYNFNVKLEVSALLCSAFTLDDPLDEACSTLYTINDTRRWNWIEGGARVFKNGIYIGVYVLGGRSANLDPGYINFTMNPSDTILVMLYGNKEAGTYLNTKVTVDTITEINGEVEVSNEGLEFYLTTNYTLE